MIKKGYYFVLFFTIVNLLALMGLLSGLAMGTYLAEVFVLLAFLALSAIALYLISTRNKVAWPFSIFFFSLNLMNAVYMFFYNLSVLLIIYAASSLFGFIISIYRIDMNPKRRKKVKVVVGAAKSINKPSKKKTAKKKTTAKKIGKRPTKKKVAKKKVVKKKVAKKKVAKKKAVKKKTTKKKISKK